METSARGFHVYFPLEKRDLAPVSEQGVEFLFQSEVY
jgi:hypothetical protein